MMKQIKNYYSAILLLIVLAGIVPFNCMAIDNQVLFLNAQKAYEEKDYSQAIIAYHKILSNDVVAPEVFYNLGNCYFKTDSIGKAIQYYEKARKLIGDEEDLMHNLKMAHAKTVDKIEPMPEFVVTSTWKNIVNFKTADTWANYALVNFVFVFITLVLFQLAKQTSIKKTFFGLALVLALMSSIFYALAKSRTNADNSINQGVLLVGSSAVKSEPLNSATDLFVIHEGTVFRIIEIQNEWIKIRLDNGNLGWLQKNSIGEI
jgi:tetratricopeptide (TPR) repeat protein